MPEFYVNWREREDKPNELKSVEDVLRWWEDPAFEMPDWYFLEKNKCSQ